MAIGRWWCTGSGLSAKHAQWQRDDDGAGTRIDSAGDTVTVAIIAAIIGHRAKDQKRRKLPFVTLVTLAYIYGVRAREYVYIGGSVTSVTVTDASRENSGHLVFSLS